MSKWLEVVLDNVCKTITDGTHLTPALAESGVPLYNGADINNMKIYNALPSKFISIETDNNLATRCKPQGYDVLISSRGSIGKIAIVEVGQDFNIMGNIILCRPNQEKLLPWFLGYYLKGKQKKLEELAHGVAQKGLYLSTVRELEIPLPPLETQKQIAKTLDTAAELLGMRKQQLAELDNLIKSTFYDMFGDPESNEMDWEKRKIVDIAKVETGSTPNRNNMTYYDDGLIPWVKTGEISNGYIERAEEKISETAIKETNCKVFPYNTILVAMYGQGKTRGQAGMLKIDAATNQACAAILPNDQYISEFLYRLLEIKYEDLRELGRGGNQPNLNLSIMKNFEIIAPPLPLQTQFAEIVTKIEEQKAQVKKAIDETQYLFDSLMSEYFE